MKKLFSHLLLIVAVISFVSCSNKSQDSHVDKADDDCSKVHWSYVEGEDGPDKWKDLCSGFSACGGEAQSPINISSNESMLSTELNSLNVNYTTTNVDIVNNGHTVQFNVSGENTTTIGEKEYKLLQFHFHSLSEHTIDGNHYPIEVHFVHKFSDSDFAVLGVMYEEGEAYDLFTNYLSHFPHSKGEYSSEETITLSELLPSSLNYYNYNGSLTTPPCSEVVNWYVVKTPVTASAEQIEEMSKILHGNYRPVMPLNGRTVLRFEN